ncbi:unnamed protein product [Victoria cruziana]
MQAIRRSLVSTTRNPNPNLPTTTVRCFATADESSIRKSAAAILDALALKPGGALVQNCGDSDIGKAVIELAKERKLQTLSIIEDKPGNPETIEALKALGADVVVPESYTKTWYMKRLVSELSPSAAINYSDGSQATAVAKAVVNGGTFVSYGKQLPKHVAYGGSSRKPVDWAEYMKRKNLKNFFA